MNFAGRKQIPTIMYATLLVLHSLFRWLVLVTLLYTLYRAWKGYLNKTLFSKADNAWRHWTATTAHIQLLIGFTLYLKSPLIKNFFHSVKAGIQYAEMAFFSIIHIAGMLLAIVLVTIGSAMAKRKTNDRDKFRTLLRFYALALLLILLAIPWPFSPLAGRPYLRF